MRSDLRFAAIALAFACMHGAAFAQTVSEATATVTLVMPLEVTKQSDLSFGTLSVGADGAATIDVFGNLTTSPGIDPISGPTSPAGFHVVGVPGQTYTVSASETDLTGPNSYVLPLTLSPSSYPFDYVLNNGFAFGGTLTLTTAAPQGTYTGTITFTATYQ